MTQPLPPSHTSSPRPSPEASGAVSEAVPPPPRPASQLSYHSPELGPRWWRWMQLAFPATVAAAGIGGRLALDNGMRGVPRPGDLEPVFSAMAYLGGLWLATLYVLLYSRALAFWKSAQIAGAAVLLLALRALLVTLDGRKVLVWWPPASMSEGLYWSFVAAGVGLILLLVGILAGRVSPTVTVEEMEDES